MSNVTEADRMGAGLRVVRRWTPLVAAWLVVLVPAFWGIWQVVLKSLALFR